MDIPSSLGKYPILGVLGKGAMGVVYRGYDPLIKRHVAIKTILRELLDGDLHSEHVSLRFRKEAQAAGALNHPGIVGVYEYGETEQYAYIAMECIEGTSLRDCFNAGTRFPENDVVSIMAQLLDALQFAHDHGVVHRDVKPANIIIMKNGRVKLADFGIARLEAGDRTQTNLIMGTPGYIAPEYYLNDPIDHRVDVYAAGVVFYELLSGRVPFSGSPEAVMRAVCYDEPAAPSSLDSERCWTQYDPIVARALRKKAQNRFRSAAEFRTDLLLEYKRPLPDSVATTVMYAKPPEAEVALPPTPAPTGWDAGVLTTVKDELAQFLGPMAKVLVQRSARQCRDIENLVDRLAELIPSEPDRKAFERRVLDRLAAQRASSMSISGSRHFQASGARAASAVSSLPSQASASRAAAGLSGSTPPAGTRSAGGQPVSAAAASARFMAQTIATKSVTGGRDAAGRRDTDGERDSGGARQTGSGRETAGAADAGGARERAGAQETAGGGTLATAEDVEDLVRRLALHIGPLARVVARRIQGEGLTRAALFMRAAQELQNETARRRFLEEAGLRD